MDGSVYCNYCGTKQEVNPHRPKQRGNGQGTVYKLPNGRYRAVVTLAYYMGADGTQKRKIRSKEFLKKSDAIAYLPTLKQAAEKPIDYTLHDLYSDYIASKAYESLSKSQHDKLFYAWKRLSPLEFRGISTLTVADIEDTIEQATSTYYPARDMKVLLSHLYQIAIKREVVTANKTDYVELPDAPKAKRECWTRDEVNAMWDDYKDHPFTAYPLIMCYTGMRYGELSTQLLENIHLDDNYMIGGIKTDAGIDREIPIHRRIRPLLEAIVPQRKTRLLEMNEDNFYAAYWQMIDRTGIRHLPPHTCRHYYFTALTAAGVQAGLIAETGGHASYVTTMRNYVRVSVEDKIRAVNELE